MAEKRIWRVAAALGAMAGLAALASRWRAAPRELVEPERMSLVDEAGIESFPASDPPSWTLGTLREL